MKSPWLAHVLAIFLGLISLGGDLLAGIATSTVQQDGTKTSFNGIGSAHRIGTYDFDFPYGLTGLNFIKARIRLWVQLPEEAIGDLAPIIVFAKVGTTNLEQALITGDAVRTDIRISYNLIESGPGVVEKQTKFENLTQQQDLALSAILASDPGYRLEAWLVSDTLTAITVPATGEYLDFSNGFPTVVIRNFDSTLDLAYVPEPSANLIFGSLGLLLISWNRTCRRHKSSAFQKGKIESCPA